MSKVVLYQHVFSGMRMALSLERLRELLDYNPETGVMTWRVNKSGSRNGAVNAGSVAGTKHNMGYISIGIDRRRYLAHRLAWLYIHGRWPKDGIDHINGDRSDNRLCNLREATQRQNGCNTRIPTTNTSGVKGVVWFKSRQKWNARIMIGGKQKNLGYFDDFEVAVAVRKAAEFHHQGEYRKVA